MPKNKVLKALRHANYINKKRFFRKFGRKPYTLLTKDLRSQRKKRIRKKQGQKQEPPTVVIPSILSLRTPYRKELFNIIEKMHGFIASGMKTRGFIIDHTKMDDIEPEALLILASEIKRLSNSLPSGRRFRYSKKYAPKSNHIKGLLASIGYWEHFDIRNDRHSDGTKEFFQIHHDTKSDFSCIVDMRDFFDDKLSFIGSSDVREAFDNALTEAIANAVEHAYMERPKSTACIDGAWWVAGYYDKINQELIFGCYDHGIGIRRSLLLHGTDRVGRWAKLVNITTKDDASTIRLLLSRKIRTNNKADRGYGTQQFIKLIKKYEAGSLDVYSASGHYNITVNENHTTSTTNRYNEKMDGTLIVWKIKVERER